MKTTRYAIIPVMGKYLVRTIELLKENETPINRIVYNVDSILDIDSIKEAKLDDTMIYSVEFIKKGKGNIVVDMGNGQIGLLENYRKKTLQDSMEKRRNYLDKMQAGDEIMDVKNQHRYSFIGIAYSVPDDDSRMLGSKVVMCDKSNGDKLYFVSTAVFVGSMIQSNTIFRYSLGGDSAYYNGLANAVVF